MQSILITGATSGIGQATAEALARRAANANPIRLLLTGRRKERLEALKKSLSSVAVIVEIYELDVREKDAVGKFAEKLGGAKIIPDVLINNAGLAAGRDPFQSSSLADAEQMIDTNVKGLIYVTHALLQQMIARGSGHIVNIGSVAGRFTYPSGAVYCASKFAVGAFSEALRLDVSGKGIRVTNIEPGMVETEFSLVRFKGDEGQAKAVYHGMQPLVPDDIARTILWVLEQPPHVNIQEILIMPTAQASVRDVARR